jgi:hypothetical protein
MCYQSCQIGFHISSLLIFTKDDYNIFNVDYTSNCLVKCHTCTPIGVLRKFWFTLPFNLYLFIYIHRTSVRQLENVYPNLCIVNWVNVGHLSLPWLKLIILQKPISPYLVYIYFEFNKYDMFTIIACKSFWYIYNIHSTTTTQNSWKNKI